MHGMKSRLAASALLLAAGALAARAEAIETGQVVPDLTLRRVEGGSAPVVERGASVTALVFFRAQHERSLDTLKMLATCQHRFAGKPVRMVGLVPADSAEGAKGAVATTGAKLEVLVDADDAVYSSLGVRMHPGIAVVDGARRVVAFEPYHNVDFCEIVTARIRRALGEIDDAAVAKALAPPPSQLPGGDDHAGVARRHVLLGQKLLAARSYALAHDNARKAIQVAPSADAWTLEGEVFAAEGKCPEAATAFEKALALDPKAAPASAGKQACAR
jgi:hypothetical protein